MAPPQPSKAVARGYSALPAAPITPGAPRANLTVDKEHPEGSVTPPQMTVLQQHMAFWARTDADTVWPRDTFTGFRALGFPLSISILAVPVIHNIFSYWTQNSWVRQSCF